MIRMLVDSDGDGRFDNSTMFADKMTFPMGAMWHGGALFAASSPHVWRLVEGSGEHAGKATQREVFVEKFEFAGNGCDIHGPFWGPDGNIYWANCQRKFAIPRKEGGVLQGKAAGIFRIRPDGRQVEMVCAGGMDNPVEVAFTDEGEAFATVDLLIGGSRPRSDGIIHCIEGGLCPYQKLDRSFHRTGEVLPAVIDLGWVAPAGLMRYRDDVFGHEFRDNLFTAHFNTHRVVRHVIERDGATFRGRSEEFLVSDDPDFHPTDVVQDADGSLLVVDTGGWFLRGCPTSQIAKPDIKGAIYRVRRAGAPKVQDARGQSIDWQRLSLDELVAYLDDPRWVVRDRAVELLGMRGGDAVRSLKNAIGKGRSTLQERNAVWTLHRIHDPSARAAIRFALSHHTDSVRLTAVTSVGQWRDHEAAALLTTLLKEDPMSAVQREAATALGRIGHAKGASALRESLSGHNDRFLEHAQIYALIRIADRHRTLAGLEHRDPRVVRAALLALDQMEHGDLAKDHVIPFLSSDDDDLQHTALSIAVAHADWAESTAGAIGRWLTQESLAERNQLLFRNTLIAILDQPVIQNTVNAALAKETKVPLVNQLLLLEAMSQAHVKRPPEPWVETLSHLLQSTNEAIVHQAILTIQSQNWPEFDKILLSIAGGTQGSAELRLAALGAAANRLTTLDPDLFSFAIEHLDPQDSLLNRISSASVLGRVRLSESQLEALSPVVARAGAVELPYLMSAFEKTTSIKARLDFVKSLEQAPGIDAISTETVRRTLSQSPDEVWQAATPLLQRLDRGVEQQVHRLKELEPLLSGGNPVQGKIVFFGRKAACAACHVVGNQGTSIGPDLSKIGTIRTPRDLLESIVFPSASIVRSFEPYSVVTRSGQIHNGLLKHVTVDSLALVDSERKEIRLSRSEIEEMQPSRISIMPKGLDTQLSAQELSDLIAYLVARK